MKLLTNDIDDRIQIYRLFLAHRQILLVNQM